MAAYVVANVRVEDPERYAEYVARVPPTVELWNGNVEPGWHNSLRGLVWPALRRAFENRRAFPARYAGRDVRRLRSDAEVGAFIQSIQATVVTSGSSNGSERQKTPPFADT